MNRPNRSTLPGMRKPLESKLKRACTRSPNVEKSFTLAVDERDIVVIVDTYEERGVVVTYAVALKIPLHRVNTLRVPGRVQEYHAFRRLTGILSRSVRRCSTGCLRRAGQ